MAEKNLNAETPTTETLADGSVVHFDAARRPVKVEDFSGEVYTAVNISAKADPLLVKRVEDYRWANKMSVSALVLKAVTEFLDAHESAKA